MDKSIEPPFKPNVKNDRDTSNIDKAFLGERPVDSPVNTKLTLSQQEKAYFEQFTYNGDEDEYLLNGDFALKEGGDSPAKVSHEESPKSSNKQQKVEPEKTPEIESVGDNELNQ